MPVRSPALRRARTAALTLTAASLSWATLAHDGGRRHDLPQLSPAVPAALVGTCESLLARLAGLANTVVTSASTVAAGTLVVAGQPVPAHCRVTGRMHERVSAVDGKTYAIGFEMRLPVVWNGRFWHQGNGGIDGSVVTASGTFGGGPTTSALLQGFAVLSSDAGHTLAQGGPAFGFDPQARLDYGYQAVGKLTPMARQAIAEAYGKGPDRSYFGGCSNGGRHTLVAAARYADQYDGFLAGAPGYNLPLAALANIFGAQRYASVATADPSTPAGLETAFTAAERQTVASAVLARCDAIDGAVDGLVQDTRACQHRFNLFRDVPTCTSARDGTCLSQAQKLAIAPIFRGATTSNGERFYAGFPYDSGIGAGGIPFWEFTAPLALDSGAVGVIFKVPPSVAALANGAQFALNLDIDQTLAELFATDALYTESAMSFMTPPDATELNDLRRRGAKVIVYHGVSDPIFSVQDSEAWYRGVDHRSGGRAEQFARLYNVPGMGHCAGGPATDQADFITPLVEWVEQGKAPSGIVARARGAGNAGGPNPEVPADWSATRTRPLCPYPSVARYKGHGSIETASSFVCAASAAGHGHGPGGRW
ncbi:MAG: tannase/feruloyl esterase family alpha/beta hydrolase [Burkholderiales bacterium]|nr:tannase/feruloyl esterase family alpha/beta hydrolase [Burkholderiales bacterium]